MRLMIGQVRLALGLLAAAGLMAGCQEKTGALTASEEQRIDSGLVRRADDLIFRYTHDTGRRDAG